MKNKKIKLTFFSDLIIFFILVAVFGLTIVSPFQKVNGNNQNNVYYSGNTKNNMVTLMINVYWGNEFLYDILNILKQHNITTTFFVGGSWVEKHSDLFLSIAECGHEIGNHGFFHKDHSKLSYSENQTEILACHKIVKTYANVSMDLFAPPSGYIGDNVLSAATDLGYKVIMWTHDTIDWRDDDVDLIVKRATNNVKAGDLILMHPTKATALALPSILEIMYQKGFTVGTVSKNI